MARAAGGAGGCDGVSERRRDLVVEMQPALPESKQSRCTGDAEDMHLVQRKGETDAIVPLDRDID